MDSSMTKVNDRKLKLKRIKRDAASNWELYLFLLIPVAYIIIFRYIPMYGVQIAFKRYSFNRGIWGSPWVGVDQFIRFFTNPLFRGLIRNTLTLSLYGLVATFPLPIILALGLNSMRNIRYKKFIQMIT